MYRVWGLRFSVQAFEGLGLKHDRVYLSIVLSTEEATS